MYNKKKTSKINKKAKRYSKNANSCELNKTSFQICENDVTNLQRSENCDNSIQPSGTKLAVCLFRKPLISKRGWKKVKQVWKGKEDSKVKGVMMCIGSLFIFSHPLILAAFSTTGIILEPNDNIINVFVNVGILSNAIFHIVNYLDDVDILFSSIFDIGNKSLARFSADLLIKELGLKGLQIFGIFYQFMSGEKSKVPFTFELFSFLVHLAGNIMLLLGREKTATPTVNDRHELSIQTPREPNSIIRVLDSDTASNM